MSEAVAPKAMVRETIKAGIERRELLRVLAAGAGVAAAAAMPVTATAATATVQNKGKDGKARYQADSSEVQTFYRVNRYPAK